MRKKGLAASTVAIKVRYSDFTTFTRQMALAQPTDDDHEIERAARVPFGRAWHKHRPVRLLGVAGRGLGTAPGQLRLWPAEGEGG